MNSAMQHAGREGSFSKFSKLPQELQCMTWEFAIDDIQPRVIEFEANLPKPDGRCINTLIRTNRAKVVGHYTYGVHGNVRQGNIIEYPGGLTFRCAFSTEFQYANGKPPAPLHVNRLSRYLALKSYQLCFSSFLEHPIYYNPRQDIVYINEINGAKEDISYRANPFKNASEKDMKLITHLAFKKDDILLERNTDVWMYSYMRYLIQHLSNVKLVSYLSETSADSLFEDPANSLSVALRNGVLEEGLFDDSDNNIAINEHAPGYESLFQVHDTLMYDLERGGRAWWSGYWEEFFSDGAIGHFYPDEEEERDTDSPDWSIPYHQLRNYDDMGIPSPDLNRRTSRNATDLVHDAFISDLPQTSEASTQTSDASSQVDEPIDSKDDGSLSSNTESTNSDSEMED
ncbi:hypothetical protein NHQ30_009103 [Ciborinia camelliae]|nr:hypothetical protein NHQ30_009103 [Ciborinia camelliae]